VLPCTVLLFWYHEKNTFNSLFSRTTWLSRHQKGQTNLDFNEARDDGVAVASGGPHANHLHLTPDRQPRQHLISHRFTGRMLFLMLNQHCQSTEGNILIPQENRNLGYNVTHKTRSENGIKMH